MSPAGRWIERGPLSAEERRRLHLLGDGSAARGSGVDEGGRPISITRMVILPIIAPLRRSDSESDPVRNERELRRIELELWEGAAGTRWIEFVPDEPTYTDPFDAIDVDVAEWS